MVEQNHPTNFNHTVRITRLSRGLPASPVGYPLQVLRFSPSQIPHLGYPAPHIPKLTLFNHDNLQRFRGLLPVLPVRLAGYKPGIAPYSQ
jgi:hypothetical protein